MGDLRTSLVASITGRALTALLALLALPVYVGFLGIEAYGVIGLFASLQVLVAFMDLGLGTALTRQLAASAEPGSRADARDTALSFEVAYVALAVLAGAVLVFAAPWVATNWVNPTFLTAAEVSRALQLAGLSLACGWPANLYGAGLAGLHRQSQLALSTAGFAALRVGLSVAFLVQVPTLESFFWAQVVASLLQSIAMRRQLWAALALPGHRSQLQWSALRRSGRFAGGMTAITICSIMLVQMDKLILSYLLRLSDFGVYVIAGSVATGLYVLISPVFTVMYPRISALWSANDVAGVTELYHVSSQAMAVLVLPLAAIMACFPARTLFVLTGDAAISQQGAWILVFLVLGAALNGVLNMPYALQLAAGWTGLSVWINAISVVLLAPATWWAATRYGAVGGAAAWGLLNVGYLVITPQLLHRKLLGAEKWRWYGQDVLMPGAVSVSVALALWAVVGDEPGSRLLSLVNLAVCWIVVFTATLGVLTRVRAQVAQLIRR